MPPAPPNHPSPLPLLWQAPAILWTMLVAQMVALILSLVPGLAIERLIYLGLMSLLLQWIALLTLLLSRVFARWLMRLDTPRLVWALVLLLVLASLLVCTLAAFTLPEGLLEQAIRLGWLQITGMALIVGALGALAFQGHWQSRQLALRAKQAELDVLRARVDPHFLFNALNTAVALLHTRPEDAEQVLLDLSDLFRAALSGRQVHDIADEIELTRRYLEIEQLRLGERLHVDWALPARLPKVLLPTLCLQTLVENAVRHGIEHLPEGGVIHIEAEAEEGRLCLRTRNRLPAQNAGRQGHQVGIAATRARLEGLAGDDSASLVTTCRDGDYIAEIRLPLPA